MAIAFRNGSAAGAGNGSNITLTPPTGLSDNDILVMSLYKENANDVTWPTGFTEVAAILSANSSFKHYVAWKRAASESGNYTASWTGSTWRDCVLLAYSGATTSGDPNDVTPTTIANGSQDNIATVPSITPIASDDMLIVFGTNFGVSDVNAWGAPSGMNLRNKSSDLASADLLLSSNSPTGSKNFTITATTGQTTGISVVLKALVTATYYTAWFYA